VTPSIVSNSDPSVMGRITHNILGDPNQATRIALQFVKGFSDMLSLLIQLFLRPNFGSRYIHPFVGILAGLGNNMLFTFGVVKHVTTHSRGLIGVSTLVVLFWLATIFHTRRIFRRVMHPETEADSEEDGGSWFRHASWTRSRILYEPLSVFLAAIVFYALHITDLFASIYLAVMAIALAMKSSILWFEAWSVIRDLMDKQHRMPILESISQGKPAPETIGGFVLAGIPPSTSAKDRAAIAGKMAGLTPDLMAILSPVKHAATT